VFRKKAVILTLVLVMVLGSANIVLAAGPSPFATPPTPEWPHNGAVAPDYQPSPQDLRALQIKTKSLMDSIDPDYHEGFAVHRGTPHFAMPPVARGVTPKWWYYYRVLPLEKVWKEPNDAAHVNYCGPGATQVALDVRLPKSEVPDIDTIGRMEHINPHWGVYMSNVVITLNNILRVHGDIPNSNGFVAYELAYPDSMWNLFWYIRWDIQKGYATVSGVKTDYMPGWNGRKAYHIVAVFGIYYDSEYNNYYKYAETASRMAGYNGPFAQWAFWQDFYQWYSQNPVISW